MIDSIVTTTTTEKNYHNPADDSVTKRIETAYRLDTTDRVHLGYAAISVERGNVFGPDGCEHTVVLHNYSQDLIAEAALALIRRAVSELDDTSDFSRNRARDFVERVAAILPTSRVTLPGEV